MENKKSGLLILIIVLSLLVIGLGSYLVYDKVSKDNEIIDDKENDNTDTPITQINESSLETEISKAIIKIANEELFVFEDSVYAEGHKTLRSEIKNNQIYAYVLATYGAYIKENGQWDITSGSAGPLVLVFNIKSNSNYEYDSSTLPPESCGNVSCASLIFPSDLIVEAENNQDFSTDYYQNQIKKYLN